MLKISSMKRLKDIALLSLPSIWILLPVFPSTWVWRLISLLFVLPALWASLNLYYGNKNRYNYYVLAISVLSVYKSYIGADILFPLILILYLFVILLSPLSVYISLLIIWALVHLYFIVFFPSWTMFIYMILSLGGFVLIKQYLFSIDRKGVFDEEEYNDNKEKVFTSVSINDTDKLKDALNADYIASLKESFRIEEIINSMFDIIKDVLGIRTVALFMIEEGFKSKHLYLSIAKSNIPLLKESTVNEGEGVPGWVLKEKEIYLNNNYISFPDTLRIYEKPTEVGSVIGIPLKYEKEGKFQTMGVLIMDSEKKDFFNYDKVRLIDKWVNMLAMDIYTSIAIKTLHSEAIQIKAISELLQRLTANMYLSSVMSEITDVISDMFEYDALFIGYRTSDSHIKVLHYEGLPLNKDSDKIISLMSESFIHFVVSSGDAVIKNNISSVSMPPIRKGMQMGRMESLIAVPMRDKYMTRGIIMLLHGDRDKYGEKEQEWLELIANISLSAIQRANMYEKVQDQSRRDGLTGLYNRKYFDDTLKTEISVALRTGYRIGLIMIDIDYFKKFNDNYGHLTGDAVLKHIANIIEEEISMDGFAARYGGEEFAIVLTHIEEPEFVLEFAEHLRKRIEREKISFMGNVLSITVSMGICIYPDDAENLKSLIAVADGNLYKAKERGRNRVIYHRRDL